MMGRPMVRWKDRMSISCFILKQFFLVRSEHVQANSLGGNFAKSQD